MAARWKQRPPGSNWGDFGPDDQLGRLNLLTSEKVKQGIAEVREGLVFNLSLPLDYPGGNKLNPRRHPPRLQPSMRDGKPYLAVGSPGGSTIINYVAKTLIAVLDWHMNIQQAIALPNLGSRNHGVELERGTDLVKLEPGLRAMGHKVEEMDFPSGLQGIVIGPDGLTGGADPRREGVALGD